jgi:hypothetical protein
MLNGDGAARCNTQEADKALNDLIFYKAIAAVKYFTICCCTDEIKKFTDEGYFLRKLGKL